MLALAYSFSLFVIWTLVGRALFVVFAPRFGALRSWLLAPAMGLAVFLLTLMTLNQLGLPIGRFSRVMTASLTLASLAVLGWRRATRGSSRGDEAGAKHDPNKASLVTSAATGNQPSFVTSAATGKSATRTGVVSRPSQPRHLGCYTERECSAILPWRQLRPFIYAAVFSLLWTGWPALHAGFNWISYGNDDMANYCLAAERFAAHGFFAVPTMAELSGRDYSSYYFFMHVADMMRFGAEHIVSWGATLAGLKATQAFMPVLLATALAQIFAAAGLALQAGRHRRRALLAGWLLAVSPLFMLGTLYQLGAQVPGITLLLLLLALLTRTWGTIRRRDVIRYSGLTSIAAAALCICYPEPTPFLGLAYVLFLALGFARRRVSLDGAITVLAYTLLGAVILLRYNAISYVSTLVMQLGSATHEANLLLSLFPYFLLPTGFSNLFGWMPIAKDFAEPAVTLSIAGGMGLSVLLLWRTVREAWQLQAAALLLLVEGAVAVQLYRGGNDFPLYKLAMWMQPTLAIAIAGLLVNLRWGRLGASRSSVADIPCGPSDRPDREMRRPRVSLRESLGSIPAALWAAIRGRESRDPGRAAEIRPNGPADASPGCNPGIKVETTSGAPTGRRNDEPTASQTEHGRDARATPGQADHGRDARATPDPSLRVEAAAPLRTAGNATISPRLAMVAVVLFGLSTAPSALHYTKTSQGTVAGGMTELRYASKLGMEIQTPADPARQITATIENVVAAKFAASELRGYQLAFASRDYFFPNTRVDFRNPPLHVVIHPHFKQMAQARPRMLERNATLVTTSMLWRTEFSQPVLARPTDYYLDLTRQLSLFNKFGTDPAEPLRHVFELTPAIEARNHLMFVHSGRGNHYYLGDRRFISFFQQEADPFLKGGNFNGLGRFMLLRVENPTEEIYLRIAATRTALPGRTQWNSDALIHAEKETPIGIVGNGAFNLFVGPLRPHPFKDAHYVAIDFQEMTKVIMDPRSGLKAMYNRYVPLDYRRLLGWARDISALSPEEYRQLKRPTRVRYFPEDIAAAETLEFSGIYEDGWISPHSKFVLAGLPVGGCVRLRGFVPEMPGTAVGTGTLELTVGSQKHELPAAAGWFDWLVPAPAGHATTIELRFSASAPLSAGDQRPSGAKLEILEVLPGYPSQTFNYGTPGAARLPSMGIDQDGWMHRNAVIELPPSDTVTTVNLQLEFPALPGVTSGKLRVETGGASGKTIEHPLAPGRSNLRIAVGPSTATRSLRLEAGEVFRLPSPDTRERACRVIDVQLGPDA
ncbi:MAG: hypothetical protein Q7S40_25655 [Opitutaceae bacterium]|nr:hypothetical protein [Opitutaceae bacterium]